MVLAEERRLLLLLLPATTVDAEGGRWEERCKLPAWLLR